MDDLVRARRLPNIGLFHLKAVYEIECTEPSKQAPSWTRTTSKPYSLLEPLVGREEAARLEQAATNEWSAGTVGRWKVAFSSGASE